MPHTKREGHTHTPHAGINIAIMFFSGPPNNSSLRTQE
jgi:hypothetical protein